ncbi:MAG: hypothetical protein RBU37_03135 [Myxococcota bacterium]|nr:hypothetical protein [Myxococcota bacterium]
MNDVLLDELRARLTAAGSKGLRGKMGFKRKAECEALPALLKALLDSGELIELKSGKTSSYVLKSALPRVEPKALLPLVEAAGSKGLSRTLLRKRWAEASKQNVEPASLELALTALLDAGELLEQKKGRSSVLLAARFGPPTLASISQTLSTLFAEQPDRLFLEAELRKQYGKTEAAMVSEALEWLEADGVLRRVFHVKQSKAGSTQVDYFLSSPRTELSSEPAQQSKELAVPTGDADEAAQLLLSYIRLRAETGLDFVDLGALIEASGLALARVHALLRQGLERGSVRVSGTNLAIVDAHRREQAIEWRGHRCLLVQLLESWGSST